MTSAIRLRVRGPQGTETIHIETTATWHDLLSQIRAKTGVEGDFDLKYGYPPQPLNTTSVSADTPLSALPQNLNGEQLIVMPRNLTASLSNPMAKDKPRPEAVKPLPAQSLNSAPAHQPGDFPSTSTSFPSSQPPPPRSAPTDDLPTIPCPAHDGTLTLRIMPDDNSCMFRALSSAVLGSSLDGSDELRSIVAQTIQSQPETYTAALLDNKPPEDYCRWITRPDSWGGGIELSILSQHFGLEVCSVNVQDLRVDRFNDGMPTRCVLVYSGIHYDVCALTPGARADPEADRKVFEVVRMRGAGEGEEEEEEFDGGVLDAAVELCRVLQGRGYFTDVGGFSVGCNTCGEKGKGEKWAIEHARKTGHGDFGEG